MGGGEATTTGFHVRSSSAIPQGSPLWGCEVYWTDVLAPDPATLFGVPQNYFWNKLQQCPSPLPPRLAQGSASASAIDGDAAVARPVVDTIEEADREVLLIDKAQRTALAPTQFVHIYGQGPHVHALKGEQFQKKWICQWRMKVTLQFSFSFCVSVVCGMEKCWFSNIQQGTKP